MKKRRGQTSLFGEPVQYLVDTSSWIALKQHSDLVSLLPIVAALITAERLFSPGVALNECKTAKDIIDPYRAQLTKCDRIDAEYLMLVGRITRKYRRMSKPAGRKTKADPFIVALGITDGYTVVAEESLKRAIGKIPGVCQKEHVKCIPLAQMIEDERKLLAGAWSV